MRQWRMVPRMVPGGGSYCNCHARTPSGLGLQEQRNHFHIICLSHPNSGHDLTHSAETFSSCDVKVCC